MELAHSSLHQIQQSNSQEFNQLSHSSEKEEIVINEQTKDRNTIDYNPQLLRPFYPQLNSDTIENKEVVKLGIGLITYNRIDYLKSCVESIQKFTTIPYYLVIADDGSSDGSIEWCRSQGLTVITGSNQGVVWNKNRALYTLMNYTDAEFLLLIEEDCWAKSDSWANQWCEAISRWHHVNFAHSRILRSRPEAIKGGQGTPEDPYKLSLVTGQCTGCSRHAMTVVGYLDTRFRGYGFGHCEWTQRFLRANLGGVEISENDRKNFIYLSITGGLAEHDAPTNRNKKQLKRNSTVLQSILTDAVYRTPWQNESEQSILITEISESLHFNDQKNSIKQLENNTMSNQNQAFVCEVIKLISPNNSPLIGCALDEPKQNSKVDTSSIRIAGWVIGRASKVIEVEIVWNGSVIHSTKVTRSRPGVGKLYPQKPESSQSGFVTLIAQGSTLIDSNVLVQAVLQDQSRIPMYLVRFSSIETTPQKSSAPPDSSSNIQLQNLLKNQVKIPQVRQLLLNEYWQMEALMNLHSLIQLSHPLPPLRQWAASPDLAVLIYSMILEKKPQNIIEFGSGSSSLIIGYALQKLGRGQVTSLDHDHKYSQLSANLVASHRLEEYCQIYHAPLIETQIEDNSYKFYSLDKIEDIAKADMLIIDGPPASTNFLARFPAVPLLYDKLSDGCVIILDDGNRQDEKIAVDKWLQKFKDLKSLPKPQTEKGVSVLIKEMTR
ncbi:MAG: glycosyltransferase [Microcoleaceae cyanobacterium]